MLVSVRNEMEEEIKLRIVEFHSADSVAQSETFKPTCFIVSLTPPSNTGRL
jgi:hypothetical protein